MVRVALKIALFMDEDVLSAMIAANYFFSLELKMIAYALKTDKLFFLQ
jgi:hypothetical protein